MPIVLPNKGVPAHHIFARQNPLDPVCLGEPVDDKELSWWECSFEWDKSLQPYMGCCSKNVCQTTDGKCPDPTEKDRFYTTYITRSTPTSTPTGAVTTTPAAKNDSDDGHNKTTTTTIAVASSVASVAFVIIVAVLIWFLMRRRKKARMAAEYAAASQYPPPMYTDPSYPHPNDAHAAYGVGSAAIPTPDTNRNSMTKSRRWTFFGGSSRGDDASSGISPVSPVTDKAPSTTIGSRVSELGGDNMYSPGVAPVAELPEQGSGQR